MSFRRLAVERLFPHSRSVSSPMFRFNSSVLLLSWMVLLLLLIALPWPRLVAVCATASLLAVLMAPTVFRRLLRRSRWLLLAVLLMFGWMTPGMPVPWLPGATLDGLQQAMEQFSRLVISIAMVAMLLSRLDAVSLLTACHGLLRPLRLLGVDVDRLVLRLALTLHQLDKQDSSTEAPTVIYLARQSIRLPDVLLLGVVLVVAGGAWL